jgi:hypothetical protein
LKGLNQQILFIFHKILIFMIKLYRDFDMSFLIIPQVNVNFFIYFKLNHVTQIKDLLLVLLKTFVILF